MTLIGFSPKFMTSRHRVRILKLFWHLFLFRWLYAELCLLIFEKRSALGWRLLSVWHYIIDVVIFAFSENRQNKLLFISCMAAQNIRNLFILMFASGSRAFLDYLFNNFILLFLHWNALVVAYHYSSSSKSWVLRIDFFFIVCYQVISSFQGSGLARVWTIMVWVRSFLCWIFNANVSDYIPVFKKFPFVSNFAWVECILSLYLL